MNGGSRHLLLAFYAAALARVDGRDRVRRALLHHGPFSHVVAIGKAAGAMYLGARDALGGRIEAGLLITKYHHGPALLAGDPHLQLIEAGHPVPDAASLRAGEALLDLLAAAPPAARLLFLISGGSSALCEALVPGLTLCEWQEVNRWLLASGLPIGEMNRVRRALSRIKGGRLIPALRGRPALALLISDVPGDDPAVIGSGPLLPAVPGPLPAGLPGWVADLAQLEAPPPGEGVPIELIATNDDARAGACAAARAQGLPCEDHGATLTGELAEAAARIAAQLPGLAPGLHVWGGEITVRLPAAPGRGGRSQALALALACAIAGRDDIAILCAGTDGSDGPTEDAGALVDGGSVARALAEGWDPQAALAGADSGSCLEAAGDLIATGPTGTNVMDLLLVLVGRW